jgi:hypothetical protein
MDRTLKLIDGSLILLKATFDAINRARQVLGKAHAEGRDVTAEELRELAADTDDARAKFIATLSS